MAQNRIPDTNESVVSATALTPSDSADVSTTRALWIGSSGDVRVLLANDTSPVTFAGVPEKSILPVRIVRLYATGTTASDFLALY